MSQRKSKSAAKKMPAQPLPRRKVWLFRLMALAGVPLVLLALLELSLRLFSFGYPTSFLLKSANRNQETFVQNQQFGWRFFGPRAARLPFPMSIAREKPSGMIRIFVFGESAAYGDPQPRFGLPRMLHVVLESRHPGKKFEVVNAAMTGINSHVIRPLARDCADADADVWVIYMGNNEVVGPFGAGTIFGGQATPLPLIRAGLALKTTRTGQLFDGLRGTAGRNAAGGIEWEGMKMFVDFKLSESDPRLPAVYRNFKQNLKDIIAAGRSSGAKIVLSTMAVNLMDCAPFASLHRSGLAESSLTDWQRFFDIGVKAQAEGDFETAAASYDEAQRLDDTFAELRFRRGQCAISLNDVARARKEFSAARDLDALRFRCDSRLNDLIRQHAAGDVTLADGERALAEASSNGLTGAECFFEHVHLTFQGNYLLARAIAEKVEETLALPTNNPWPDRTECARRLGYTSRDTQMALSMVLGRLAEVPFTFQFNRDEQVRRLAEASRVLPPANSAASLHEAQSSVEAALARWPEDGELWDQLAEIKGKSGDFAGAIAAVERAFDRVLSRGPETWLFYGTLLAQEKRFEDAIAAFKRVDVYYSRADWAGYNLALCLERLGRREEAVAALKRVLILNPNYGTGWLALGQLHEQSGRTKDAERCYQTALTNSSNKVDDLLRLARFCASRRWWEPAVTNYTAAIRLSPSDASVRIEAGRALLVLGRHDEAVEQFQAATELTPEQPQAHLQLGFELGRLGKLPLAEKAFRQVLRINPELTEARVALGVALYDQKKIDEAREQFEAVLQRNPEDETSRRYIRQLLQHSPPH
jgi:tetratricopeptide (TPR) repeat protein